ncbi:MAG: phosphate/phosphite/phosphonate ABC transporter substrate-binding protein [Limisphaerales bacterium]
MFRVFIGSVVSLFALAFPIRSQAAEPVGSTFRFGFSSSMFSDVNENDAKAAVKVWAQMLFKERGLPVEPDPTILKGPEDMAQALRGKLVDALALPVDEYWMVREELDPGVFIAGLNEGQITEEYVLLVHRDSAIKRIKDLRGRSVGCWQNSRMSLGPAWLDTILVQGGFPRATEFCRVTQINKLSRAVLPVFFRQADACVVTRRGFNNMVELNPQVGQRLKVLATSPALVPSGFCFRRGYDDPLRDTIVAELVKIHSSAAGMQALTLFLSGSLEAHPVSCLDSALALLATHARLCGETNQVLAFETKVPAARANGGGN